MADVESLELQITGDARSAEQSINSLISTLERLNQATAGGCGLGAVANGMKNIGSASSSASSANTKSAASFGKLATKVAVAYTALSKVGKVIASWMNESNEYIENVNLFSVSMGEYAESAMEYANTVSDLMGIDPSDWIRSQGVFMTLATGFGVASDRANTMSQQLTQLGYDISSFRNISVEEAMTKLTSGLAGEIEPLRSIGYDLSQARLEAIALSLGIDKAVSSMTQAEKAELRYYAIMTQVTQVQGDMARTLQEPANQLRILQAQVTQAARAFGNLFIPVLNAVLPVVTAVVKVITMLAQAIASLFGISLEVDFDKASSSAGDLGASVAETSDGLGGAADNAKKLRKILLGIDELNVMTDPSAGGGGAGGAGGGDGFDFELPTYNFIDDATNQKINEITEKIKEWLGLSEEINSWAEFLDTRLGRILSLVGAIAAGIALWKVSNGFIDAIESLKKLTMNPTQSIVLGATLAITGFTISFAGMKDAIQDGLDGFNFAEIVGGGLLGTGGAAILGSALAKWISTAFAGGAIDLAITQAGINLGVGTAAAAGAAILGSVAAVIAGIPAYFVGIYDAVIHGIDWLNGLLIGAGATAAGAGIGAIIGMLGGPIGAGIGALIGLAVGLITDGVILIVQNWEAISAWFVQAFTTVGQFFADLWVGIQGVWSEVATWFDTNVVQPVVGFFVGLWDEISTTASECWEAIVDFFSPAFDWFSQLFGSVFQTLSDIFYNIGVIAKGCWAIIQAAWGVASTWFNTKIITPVKNFFTNLWNGIQTAAINAWNGIKSVYTTISNWINTTIIQPVSSFFSNLWTGFINGAKNAWAGVKTVFGTVASFFRDTFQKAWAGIVKVFSVAGQIFVDIKNGIVTAFKSVVNGLIRGINRVVSIPFNAINSALTTIRNISILGLTPFSNLRSISVPSIPYLAGGGTVNAGQLFVAREAGPELVANAGRKTAVMNNDQIVESVSQGVYRAFIQAMAESGNNQVVEAKVNDKVLFEVIVGRNRQETMRTGRSPLLGGV
jgi:phage-related protein